MTDPLRLHPNGGAGGGAALARENALVAASPGCPARQSHHLWQANQRAQPVATSSRRRSGFTSCARPSRSARRQEGDALLQRQSCRVRPLRDTSKARGGRRAAPRGTDTQHSLAPGASRRRQWRVVRPPLPEQLSPPYASEAAAGVSLPVRSGVVRRTERLSRRSRRIHGYRGCARDRQVHGNPAASACQGWLVAASSGNSRMNSISETRDSDDSYRTGLLRSTGGMDTAV